MSKAAGLSIEEQIELIAYNVDNINSQFELWLTITFAVIIASYIAGHRLSRTLRAWFAALYLMVSVLLFLMLAGSGATIQTVLAGAEIAAPLQMSGPLGLTIIILRTLVFLLGTGVTLFFIFRGFRERDS